MRGRQVPTLTAVLRGLVLAGTLCALMGCAAVVLTAGGIAASAGVNHTLSGIAYKTFNEPVSRLRVAVLIALDDLAMDVTHDGATDDGWEINAAAHDREIDIELEELSARATRMRVVANEGAIFFKDSATATEIIIQTAENLADSELAGTE